MFEVTFRPDALYDVNQIALSNPKPSRKVFQLAQDISQHPYEGIGKPEALKHNLAGYWSRRIDDEHRMVYRVEGNFVIIISCKGHYETE